MSSSNNCVPRLLKDLNRCTDLLNDITDIFSKFDPKGVADLSQLTTEDMDKVVIAVQKEQKEIDDFHVLLIQMSDNPSLVPPRLSKLRHDMRNHVNGIRGYSEIIVEELSASQKPIEQQLSLQFKEIHRISNLLLGVIDTLKEVPLFDRS